MRELKKGDDSEIVRLHDEGKTFREIGRLLGISHVAVRKRYLKTVKVTRVTNANQAPEKIGLADQVSSATENYAESCGNLGKPEKLKRTNVTEVNSERIEDSQQYLDSYQTVNQKGYGVPPLGGAKNTLTAEALAEPKYYRHIPTGQLFHRNAKIDEEIMPQCEPYFPPQYLKKMSEPNKGGIYAWTPALDRRSDMEPYEGELPGISTRKGS